MKTIWWTLSAVGVFILALSATRPLQAAAMVGPRGVARVVAGVLSNAALNEVSGLAASRRNPQVLWLHNDSGDRARIFAVNTAGRLLGIYTLPGVTAIDCEDIAVGPGPGKGTSYIYVGDIGDNDAWRPFVTVYRMPEPAVAASNAPTAQTLHGVAALQCVYPGGARNAETLMIDPVTTNVYIASKTKRVTTVYCATPDAWVAGVCTLKVVRTLAMLKKATAGDISPCGDRILLRAERVAYQWQRRAGERVEDALARPPQPLPLQAEPKGEAIAADAHGTGYFTTSEGVGQPLYHYLYK